MQTDVRVYRVNHSYDYRPNWTRLSPITQLTDAAKDNDFRRPVVTVKLQESAKRQVQIQKRYTLLVIM